MSFRAAERFVSDLFPLAVGRSASSTRRKLLRQAAQFEVDMDRAASNGSTDAAAISLGIDTTFVRSAGAEGPRHHEILIGVGSNERGRTIKVGAVVAELDIPHYLIQRTLRELGQGDATQVTAFTDGDKMLRGYLKRAGLAAPPLLDWAHLARRVQIAKTTAKGLRSGTNAEARARPLIAKALDSLHWRLWHGNIQGAREALKRVAKLLRAFDIGRTRARTEIAAIRLRTAMGKLADYIDGQSAHLVNYSLRYRQGQSIGTATTEGLANTLVNQRMNKLQQMRCSAKSAHAVVTVRAHYFNQHGASRLTQSQVA
jgi:hypothetical protein